MADFATQIEQMLEDRFNSSANLPEQQRSALEQAANQSEQSIGQLRSLYSDPSKFEKSKLGAFGLGLMAPTNSGRFNEGMYNALSAATAAQDYNREANLSREEKLAKLSELEAALTRQRAADQRTVYDTQTGVIANGTQDLGTYNDLQLGKQQLGSKPLAPGQPGPVAQDQTPYGQAQLMYQDYMRNPQKYAGPQGQAAIKNAVDLLNNESDNRTRMQIAQSRSGPRPLTTVDKKIIDNAKGDNAMLKANLANLERAKQIGPKTWYGVAPDTRAKLTSWWYGDSGADQTTADEHIEYQQIMQGEAIKQMSEQLKGATTDKEMQRYIDMVADPSLPWSSKKTAVERVMAFINSQIEVNDERVAGVYDGSYYAPDGAKPNAPLGTDKYGKESTMEDIQTTMDETGLTYEQVIQKLKNGDY